MDEKTTQELLKLVKAVRAFAKSVERVTLSGMTEGAAPMMIKNYQSLHRRAAELLPDDYYITDTLALEVAAPADNQEAMTQVRLAASQLRLYLDDLLRETREPFDDVPDWGSLGRDLQSQILSVTKHTLKRALSNIDISVSGGEADEEPDHKPKRRVRVEIHRDGEADPDNE